MKKLFKFLLMSMLVVLCTTGIACAQQKVGIILEAPLSFCNDEKVHTMVDEKATKIFTSDKFELVPLADTLSAVQIYREENDMASMVTSGWAGYLVPMKKENVQEIGKSLGCEYIFFVRLTNDVPRYSAGLFNTSAKTTIACDARVMNVAKGQYTYTKQIMSQGKSTAVYMGTPSFERAYFKAFSKALDDIKIDTSKI